MNMKLCEEERESCVVVMVILEGMRSVVTFRGEQGKTCVCVPWMPVKNISTEKNLSYQKFKMPLLFS